MVCKNNVEEPEATPKAEDMLLLDGWVEKLEKESTIPPGLPWEPSLGAKRR
jgi:hypothetical protein